MELRDPPEESVTQITSQFSLRVEKVLEEHLPGRLQNDCVF